MKQLSYDLTFKLQKHNTPSFAGENNVLKYHLWSTTKTNIESRKTLTVFPENRFISQNSDAIYWVD